jgi:hypothetical protein
MINNANALPLSVLPGADGSSFKLTPTKESLEHLADAIRYDDMLTRYNEYLNACEMHERYSGGVSLYGAEDYIWWEFFAELVHRPLSEMFVETEAVLISFEEIVDDELYADA